jgi:CubicO group peptidase (beta-lactamase class C family)
VADAPFPAAGLAESLTRTVAFQLLDEGTLDPTATVDQWAPTVPNADRVTVQMLIDNTTGWGDWGVIEPDPITTDFARAWTLPEVVESRAPAIAVLSEPGTDSNDAGNSETVLGLILEAITGQSLIELVNERVSKPAGLTVTGLLDPNAIPAGYRHGVFAFNGTPVVTSDFDGTSYLTYNLAHLGAVATPTELLDLLDVWATGALFTTDRTPAPHRYAREPAEHPYLEFHSGVGVPFTAYCPCTPVEGGIDPTAFGRSPATIGTTMAMLRFADGISVVVNINSNGGGELIDLVAVGEELHQLATATN